MGEQHFHLLALPSRSHIGGRLGDLPCNVTRRLVDLPSDLAHRGVRATLFQRTMFAVVFRGTIDERVGLGDAGTRYGELAQTVAQRFAARATILMVLIAPLEVGAGKRAVVALGLVPHWHV